MTNTPFIKLICTSVILVTHAFGLTEKQQQELDSMEPIQIIESMGWRELLSNTEDFIKELTTIRNAQQAQSWIDQITKSPGGLQVYESNINDLANLDYLMTNPIHRRYTFRLLTGALVCELTYLKNQNYYHNKPLQELGDKLLKQLKDTAITGQNPQLLLNALSISQNNLEQKSDEDSIFKIIVASELLNLYVTQQKIVNNDEPFFFSKEEKKIISRAATYYKNISKDTLSSIPEPYQSIITKSVDQIPKHL